MVLITLLACGEVQDTGSTAPEEDPGTGLVMRVEPLELDFGRVNLGESREKSVLLTNKGDSLVFLSELITEDTSVRIDSGGVFGIEPGQQLEVGVIWSPIFPGELDEVLSVNVGETPAELTTFEVLIEGRVDGPQLVIAKPNTDLGDVAVGCTKRDTMRIVNSGNDDLIIDKLEFAASEHWSLWGLETNYPIDPLPWVIGPNDMQQFVVQYAPDSRGVKYASIEVWSNDPLKPTGQMSVQGNGVVDNDNELTWELRENQNVTVLLHVNEIGITQYYRQAFENALPNFFNTLNASGVHWRLAAILKETGEHEGSVDYIDQTWDVDDAIDEVFDMLAGQSQSGDNDSNLATLNAAVTAQSDWLFEDLEWEQSKLNLITINDDQDQSANNYQTYLNGWYALKPNQTDLQLHGIAGGQNASQCGAVYFGSYIDAINATGGLFYDICDSDWENWMTALGSAVLGENQPAFELEGTPKVDSIEVRQDGFMLLDWSYDAELNAVVFAEGDQPKSGTLTIYYLYTPECEE